MPAGRLQNSERKLLLWEGQRPTLPTRPSRRQSTRIHNAPPWTKMWIASHCDGSCLLLQKSCDLILTKISTPRNAKGKLFNELVEADERCETDPANSHQIFPPSTKLGVQNSVIKTGNDDLCPHYFILLNQISHQIRCDLIRLLSGKEISNRLRSSDRAI